MREVVGGRSLPGPQYPTRLARRACHQPRHRRRSSQRRWGRRPVGCSVSLAAYMPVLDAHCEVLDIDMLIGGGVIDRGWSGATNLWEGTLGEDTMIAVSVRSAQESS
jgi:hypothetical protein